LFSKFLLYGEARMVWIHFNCYVST
jgi:hypothetical protein